MQEWIVRGTPCAFPMWLSNVGNEITNALTVMKNVKTGMNFFRAK